MKFSCEKALLLGAVSTASRAVAVKSSIPALEGILIEAGEQLRLTGYNLETGIRAAVPAEIREKGSLVLSARLFGEIIRKMPDDVVVFTSENYMVNIKCGLSEFNILGTDPEEFPELPSVEEQNGLTIGQPVLRSMIAQTLFAVSDNESRPVHTGSLFEVDESGLTVVSVDGYRPFGTSLWTAARGCSPSPSWCPAPPSARWKRSAPGRMLSPWPRGPGTSSSRRGTRCWSAAGWRGSSWPIRMPSPGTTPSRSRGMPAPCSSPSSASP